MFCRSQAEQRAARTADQALETYRELGFCEVTELEQRVVEAAAMGGMRDVGGGKSIVAREDVPSLEYTGR